MIYYTDCFVLGTKNPSDIGGGYTITDKFGQVLEKKKIYKKGFTNNEGEVLGILRCIEICEQGSEIYTDSMCACAWIRDGRSKSRKDLTEILSFGKKSLKQKESQVIWIERNENLAGLYNEAH